MSVKKKSSQQYYNDSPTSKKKKGSYDKKYNKKTIKERMARNKARAKAMKAGKVKKGDNKDVHHVGGIKSKKTRVLTSKANRAKREKSRVKGYKQSK